MNDDFLYKFQKAPRREFAANLYERISKPMKSSKRTRSFRTTAPAFSMIIVVVAVLILSPTTRTLADSIIRQFGVYIFVQATPEPKPNEIEKTGQEGAAIQDVKKDPMQDQADQLKEQALANRNATASYARDATAASQLAGFTVLAPTYLPDGYLIKTTENASGEWEVIQDNSGVRASLSYENQAANSFLTIEELESQEGLSKTVERPEIVDLTVRGQSGVWMPDDHGKTTLAWDENGITYLVLSNTLSFDEILKVAESLGK